MTEWLTSLRINLDLIPHFIALLVAYALSLPIGWDRERNERGAGLRTFPLVAIATCCFVQAAERVTLGEAEATARIVEGLIAGMGFIGGGAILVVKTASVVLPWRPAFGRRGRSALQWGSAPMTPPIVLSIVTFLTLRRVMKNLKPSKNEDDIQEDR